MKKVCLLLLISLSVMGIGQTPDTTRQNGIRPKLIPDAATAEKIAKYKDSITIDTSYHPPPQYKDGSQYNYDGIIALQKEQRAKQKRNALIRIGIGVFFLVILMLSIRRNLKSK